MRVRSFSRIRFVVSACRTAAATLGTSSSSIGLSSGWVGWRVSSHDLTFERDKRTIKTSSSCLPFFFFVPRRPSASTSSVIPRAAHTA